MVRLTLVSAGEELATLDADPAWQLQDVLMTLPERFHETGYGARVLFGTEELAGEATLSDIGASNGATLTVVQSKVLRSLTASEDSSAKIWSAESGECLHTLIGHSHKVLSAVFSLDGELWRVVF